MRLVAGRSECDRTHRIREQLQVVPGGHTGSALTGIAVGDVIGWKFNTADPGDDHVSVVVAVFNSLVTTIDGNYSNAVTQRTINRGAAGISGYASPAI